MSAPFEHWHDFFVLVGTAAAALVALLFVAASIGAGIISFERTEATRMYMTPVVVHFTSVLLICAIGLVPSHTPISLALLIGANAAFGIVYSVILSIRVLKDQTVDLDDRLGYGIAPVIGYGVLLAAAVLVLVNSHRGPDVLAAAILLLLIVNIRNAWDLTLFMARQHTQRTRPPSP
jgi:hypothetical protein